MEGYEEYFDYIFPDDDYNKPSLKILELAHKWKQENKKRSVEHEDEAPAAPEEPVPEEPEEPTEDEDQIDIDD